MKTTQREIIIKFLKDKNDWVYSYDLIKVQTKYGWIGSSGDRTARKLREDGLLESKSDGKYEMYRYAPNPKNYKKIVYYVPALGKEITEYKKI